MKDASMSLGIYFEIKDAELYGGEGTTGYAATIVEISIEGLQMMARAFKESRCLDYEKTR